MDGHYNNNSNYIFHTHIFLFVRTQFKKSCPSLANQRISFVNYHYVNWLKFTTMYSTSIVEHTCQNFIFSGYFFPKCVLQLHTVYFCLKPVLNCKQNQILRLRPRRGRIFKKNPKITCIGGGKGPDHNYIIFSKWGFQCQDLGSPIKILDLREKSRSLR